ncbi:MAG: DUF6614 family protein [Fimbriimonadaceae bacterium]
MNLYEIWVDRGEGVGDLELTHALQTFLEYLKSKGLAHSYRISRRKFGFGPELLGEFHITIEFETLDQLDQAFMRTASRDSDVEPHHAAVFSRVTNFRAGLWRDFPDDVRVG